MAEYPSESWNREQLQEALKSKDVLIKMGAIRVLQGKPKDDYIASLVDALNDSDRLVRINAAITLGRAKSPLAVPALIHHAALDPDRDVRSYSLWAYRQVDYVKASPYLVKALLEDDNREVVRLAANEIRHKNDMKAVESIIQRFQTGGLYTGYDLDMAAINGLYEIGYSTVEPLVKCLDSEDTRVQANATYALGKIGDERAIMPLISHLEAAGLEMRSRISDALIKIGRASIPALIKLLDSKDRELKWIAAYSLARIGPESEAALLEALRQRGPEAGEEIIYALGVSGSDASFRPLYDIYSSTGDDSVRAWATIALASIVAKCHGKITDKAAVDKFLGELGERLKPHLLISHETLNSLGKLYVERGINAGEEKFKENVGLAVKCFDLSIIERDNASARAFRLFYGSYIKLMSSRSPEIMGYIERDFTDMKKDAERSSNKKEIVYLMDGLLRVLKGAYKDKGFDFVGNFNKYVKYCKQIEPFLDDFYVAEEARRPASTEQPMLHADLEMIQEKVSALLNAVRDDAESAALAHRLSLEVSRLDTGIYDDYKVVESCLKNIVSRMKLPGERKAEIQYKALLIGKNGASQVLLVLDEILKELGAAREDKPVPIVSKGRRVGLWEYVAVAIIVILLIAVIVLALNKFGFIRLPFRLPISWLNPSLAGIIMGSI